MLAPPWSIWPPCLTLQKILASHNPLWTRLLRAGLLLPGLVTALPFHSRLHQGCREASGSNLSSALWSQAHQGATQGDLGLWTTPFKPVLCSVESGGWSQNHAISTDVSQSVWPVEGEGMERKHSAVIEMVLECHKCPGLHHHLGVGDGQGPD